MARWKVLPEGLDPAVVRFVAELRRLKDETGLSVVQVADRTGYSEASWQRYFGGRALAPREAVQKLVELAGAEAATVSALQDAAQQAWRPAGPSATTEEEAEAEQGWSDPQALEDAPEPARRRLPDLRTALTSVVSALVGAAITLAVVQPWSTTTASAAPAAVAKPPAKSPVAYRCTYQQSGGQWFAGNSATVSDLVMDGDAGPEVAEIQCLLQHAGISPGGIDGAFGPMTLHAVIQEQLAHHIDVDGQVGPQTWAALRG